MSAVDLGFVDESIERLGRKQEAAIPILQAIQDHYRYLPDDALRRLTEKTEISASTLEGIASFYDMFRRKPVGQYIVRICHGTACHVKGSPLVEEAFRRSLDIRKGTDTAPDGKFTIEGVACMGCCTLAPAVQIESSTFGHVTPGNVDNVLHDFLLHPDKGAPGAEALEGSPRSGVGAATDRLVPEIRVGLGSCCMVKGSNGLYTELKQTVQRLKAPVEVKAVGCVGMCHRTPMVEVLEPNGRSVFYDDVTTAHVEALVWNHFRPKSMWRRLGHHASRLIDRFLIEETAAAQVERHALDVRDPSVSAFLDKQKHVVTEHFGNANPMDLTEYQRRGGFFALRKCLAELTPDSVIEEVLASGLRGRGGAGFPTGRKWRLVADSKADRKYVICNGDEGDPGAFMDRMLLESFPYRIIEGMAIAAVAVGAHEAVFYIRHEYPLAVQRVREAIRRCQAMGLIGPEGILGHDYGLTLSIMEGAGAFVCGEETALIASVEGKRGMPRLRPPYPAQSGLWGQPTLVNNVETLAAVPWVIRNGAEKFASIGTEKSKGTKVFALAGKVMRGGLIEVPMGLTIREIVEEIGGGVMPGRTFKAVQIGGPSGGCVPASMQHITVDFEALADVGAIMGSGGLVVLDDTDCMVDVARYFLQFTQDQSCGKCTFCRVGTRRMLDILNRICAGEGKPADLDELEFLARQVKAGSLCGLGMTAPNPIVTTLRYFRDEYEAHLQGRCPAGKCTDLIEYRVTDRCIGCTICAQQCPVDAIPLTPYRRHVIDTTLCTRCDVCRQACPESAIEVTERCR